MIDGQNNREKNVENGILLELSIFPILFLIYISRVLEQVKKKLFEIVFFSFVDNLGFIASETSVKEIAKALKKVGNLIVE